MTKEECANNICKPGIIDNYIKRRHKIVHEADKNPSRGRGNHASAPIDATTLNAWITAVDNLVTAVELVLDKNND